MLGAPSDADDTIGDPFERAAFIAQALFGQERLSVRRMFTMTNRAEQIHNDDDLIDAVNDRAAVDSEIWRLVEELYGPGTA